MADAAPVVGEELEVTRREWRGRPAWVLVARYAPMPILLALATLALYLYVNGLELDTIEQRVINRPNVQARLWEHVYLSLAATGLVIAIAVPLGVTLTRTWARRFTPIAVGLANASQAIPSLGLLILLGIWLGIGVRTALIALVAYAVLPVLRNTMVGIQQVDPAVIEAGRGMGMSSGEVLRRIEIPLAIPVILSGVRISIILCVGTVTLVRLIAAGGLGDFISVGIAMRRDPVILVGGALTAVLALFADWIAGIAEDVLTPRGL
jgi:osmoprotectant transport system permease protein